MVIVDLSRVDEIDTATLARLVALRRRLSHVAMDLRIRGLSVRGRQLYELYRLQKALPEG
jgi:ABC-type transporter Mla MlaB component